MRQEVIRLETLSAIRAIVLSIWRPFATRRKRAVMHLAHESEERATLRTFLGLVRPLSRFVAPKNAVDAIAIGAVTDDPWGATVLSHLCSDSEYRLLKRRRSRHFLAGLHHALVCERQHLGRNILKLPYPDLHRFRANSPSVDQRPLAQQPL